MALPQQIRNATISLVLSGAEVSTVPKGARPLPSIEAITATYQTTQVNNLIDANKKALGRSIKPQVPANIFKGGVKVTGKLRLSIIGADHAGFVFAELAALLDIVSDLCDAISRDHCGFIKFAKWEDVAIVNEIQPAFRQGESTQAAMERTMNEAHECCKSIAAASQITIKTMMETVKEYTYKADDNAPRTTQKKRTRL